MIDDEDHPEMIRAHHDLLGRLGKVLDRGQHQLTKPFLERLFEVVKTHKADWRTKGVDFPAQVALVVPRLGIVEFARADLELSSIRVKIVNFVQFNPAATMREVVDAFRTAYPHVKPDDVLMSRGRGVEAIERANERRSRIAGQVDRILKGESES